MFTMIDHGVHTQTPTTPEPGEPIQEPPPEDPYPVEDPIPDPKPDPEPFPTPPEPIPAYPPDVKF